MKALVAGVTRQHGISKKTNRPYDMSRLLILQPVETISREGFSREGFGFQPVELTLDDGAVQRFNKCVFPCELDLATSDRIFMGRIETIITGIAAK